jgi:hypothetical protein
MGSAGRVLAKQEVRTPQDHDPMAAGEGNNQQDFRYHFGTTRTSLAAVFSAFQPFQGP